MKTLLLIGILGIISPVCFATGPAGNCTFSGVVVDAASKRPVAHVIVVARSLSSEQKFVTNEQGEFSIPSLPDGTYTLRFEKDNYKLVEKKNVVIKNNSAKMSVELALDQSNDFNYHDWLMKIDFL